MGIGQSIKIAFKSLRSNRMRTFLTMLGVIIGVLAVSLLTTVTQSARDYVVGELKKESQVVMLRMMNSKQKLDEASLQNIVKNVRDSGAGEFDYTYTYSNSLSVNRDQMTIKAISADSLAPGKEKLAEYFVRDIPIKSVVNVVSKNYADVRNLDIVGEFVSDSDNNECVIDDAFVSAYFGEDALPESVLGKVVMLGGTSTQSVVQIALNSNALSEENEAQIATKLIAIKYEAESLFNALGNAFTQAFVFEDYDEQEMLVATVIGETTVYSLKFNLPVTAYFTDDSLQQRINMFFSLPMGENPPLKNTATVTSSGEFEGGEEYTIVGVITNESNMFNMSVDTDALNIDYTESLEMQILFETMKRQPTGSVYLVNNSKNLDLVREKDGELVGIESAHFKFADEKDISDGSGKIMIAFIDEGFAIGSFAVVSMQAVATIVDDIIGIMSLLLGVIAGISLVVGGIGIMNIMLVVVSERTREIGIRKAIGAKRSSILVQFLIEAIVITLAGGLFGILISGIAALIIGYFMGILMILPWWVVLLSIGFCMLIGVAFGVYPAIKASKLHPIDALRRE